MSQSHVAIDLTFSLFPVRTFSACTVQVDRVWADGPHGFQMNKTPFPILCSASSHALTGSFLNMLHIRIFFGFWMLYQSNSKVTPCTNTPFLSGCSCFTPFFPCYLKNPLLFNRFQYCYRIGKTFIGYIEILLLKDGKLQL